MLRSICIAAAALVAFATPATAGPAEDATAAVVDFLDKFNAGDIAAFHAAHAPGAVITDEFPPFYWTGAKSTEAWLADYGKDSAAKGISGGRVDYAAATRAEADGNRAYVVLPTVYRARQGGKAVSASGTMTFVMTRTSAGWKIASWTYAAPAAKPER
jgi:ketosteroid isomerase-like protein